MSESSREAEKPGDPEQRIAKALCDLASSQKEALAKLQLHYAELLRQADARHLEALALLDALEDQLDDTRDLLSSEKAAHATTRNEHETARSASAELRQSLDETRALLKSEKQSQADARVEAKKLRNEVSSYRRANVSAKKKLEALQRSVSFRLGNQLIRVIKNPKELLRLPARAFHFSRNPRRLPQRDPNDTDHRPTGSQHGSADAPRTSHQWSDQLDAVYSEQGLEAAETWVRRQTDDKRILARALIQLAKQVNPIDPPEALRLGRESLSLDNQPFLARWLAFRLFDAGHIREADDLLQQIGEGGLKATEQAKLRYMHGCRRLLDGGLTIPPRAKALTPSGEKRLLYVTSSSLPYHISGYTTRTHAVLQAMQRAGWDISCATRPGYPQDRPDALVGIQSVSQEIDGIRYDALSGGDRRKQPLDDYLLEAADAIEAHGRLIRPALIQAASNYEAALPALIAARRLGLPFVYEVRGLWELTAASKKSGWELGERFELDRKLEALTASQADHVLTLTKAMAGELWERGVQAGRISLAPNAIHPDEFRPLPRDAELATKLGLDSSEFIVGYIGSILVYEGLDDLLEAFVEVLRTFPGARLIIVGDGDALPSLRTLVSALKLESAVVLTGRVKHTEVQRYFSLLDAIALPRKPFRVCQLVSPLKPLEAMAMGIPMVVSDVAALREMVEDGKTALVHRADDVPSLAAALVRLGGDPSLRSALALAAREHTLTHRTWQVVATDVSASHAKLLAQRPDLPSIVSIDDDEVLDLGTGKLSTELKTRLEQQLETVLKDRGNAALQTLLRKQVTSYAPWISAFCLLRAAHLLLASGYQEDALGLANVALLRDPRAGTLKSTARLLSDAALIEQAAALCRQMTALPSSVRTDADERFIAEVLGRQRLVEMALTPANRRTLRIGPRRVLNILAFSLPYASVGCATRSHGLALGIQHAGWDIRPCTRPGFPHDFKNELIDEVLPESDDIDGIHYRRLFEIRRTENTEADYLLKSIEQYEKLIREECPAIVHAASNYVTALPALIAARRHGVPFVYEVRGVWEVTRRSQDEGLSQTPKFRYMQFFETLVARQADRVITITTAMRELLIERGVDPTQIAIAYNSADPERFQPSPPDTALRERLGIPPAIPVIGYIGSFVEYEGLDDLVTAAAELTRRGHDFRLLLVGDGAVAAALTEQIASLGLKERVIQPGRVPHDEVEAYYSLIDIAPFPRKPLEVCGLVSPLKPFEAMALEKAVVVSDTRALSEIVSDGENGLLFTKGSVDSLVAVLERLLISPHERDTLGRNARQWVINQRSWDVAGRVCTEVYAQL